MWILYEYLSMWVSEDFPLIGAWCSGVEIRHLCQYVDAHIYIYTYMATLGKVG